jgi:hypothetical protein
MHKYKGLKQKISVPLSVPCSLMNSVIQQTFAANKSSHMRYHDRTEGQSV